MWWGLAENPSGPSHGRAHCWTRHTPDPAPEAALSLASKTADVKALQFTDSPTLKKF